MSKLPTTIDTPLKSAFEMPYGKEAVRLSTKKDCDCTSERIISTVDDPEDPNAKWYCSSCGGKTVKAGFKIYSPYITIFRVPGEFNYDEEEK